MVEITDPFVREKLQEIQEARDKAKTLLHHTPEHSKPRFGAMFFIPLCFTMVFQNKRFIYSKSFHTCGQKDMMSSIVSDINRKSFKS
jgi:hypothetical protein